MIWTVYFDSGKGPDLWCQCTSARAADKVVRQLMADPTVNLITVDVTRKATR